MKTGSKFTMLLMLFACFITATSLAQNKKAEKLADIQNKIGTQNYTFIADYVTPLREVTRSLSSSDYDFRVTKDSVIAYLPYFGHAYIDVPYNPNEGGIKFTSTKFDYKLINRKKGGWSIQIDPHDVKSTGKIYLDVSPDGYASISINSVYRDEISFNGYLK